MKKSNFTLIGFIMILTLAMSCQNKPKNGRTDTYTSGTTTIVADESFRPIIEQELQVFHTMFPQTKITPLYVTEVDAVNRLLKCKDVWLAVTSRKLTPAEKNYMNSKTYEPREIRIATDGLALIINKHNPDSLITVNQIKDILTGKTKNWKQIFPTSKLGNFLIVFDNKNSSTVHFAIDSICKGQAFGDNVRAEDKNTQVIDFVSKTPNAIGIIGVNWLSDYNDSTKLSFSKKVKLMSVSAEKGKATPANCFKPYQYYLYTKQYPLTRGIYVILNDPMNGLPWGFETFLEGSQGQKIILKSGLVPDIVPVNVREVNVK